MQKLQKIVKNVLRNSYQKKLQRDSAEVLKRREKYVNYTNDEILVHSNNLKKLINSGTPLDNIIIDAFALATEVIRRQTRDNSPRGIEKGLQNGIILHQNQIECAMAMVGYDKGQSCLAEMKTGEGKTFAGVLAAYLKSLTGERVHIITSNDALAERDWEENLAIYEKLGLTTGLVKSNTSQKDKKNIYKSDVVYTSTYEVGFDYLRDNSCTNEEDKVLGELGFLIIDEVDDVILDQAKVPMILSGESDFKYLSYEQLVKINDFALSLKNSNYFGESNENNFYAVYNQNSDFVVKNDKGVKSIIVQDSGEIKIEQFFYLLTGKKVEEANELYINIYRPAIENALLANFAYVSGNDYVSELTSKGIEITIIGENTGRKLEGQKYSGGLNQALQVKESLKILDSPDYTDEQKIKVTKIDTIQSTKGMITFPSLLSMYKDVSGMSGTLLEAEEYFESIYNMEVVGIRSNKKTERVDNELEVFENSRDKAKRILELVKEKHAKGQPILIGTINIKESQFIFDLIKNNLGIECALLNANSKEEHEIIKNAGAKGAVTIATNMAGRGVNIKMSKEVEDLGGLCVIGTSLNTSERVDNQLRGRAGRQGAKGESYLFTSIDDNLYDGYRDFIDGELTPKKARHIQKIIESRDMSQLINMNKFHNYFDNLRKEYYYIRNSIISNDKDFSFLDALSDLISRSYIVHLNDKDNPFIISDSEDKMTTQDYLQYLNENKAEFGSMLKSRLKKLIPEMDRNWGMLLNSFEDIMHTITNASFSNKQANEASIYSDNFNNARNIFFSKIINIILGDNIKEVIKEHKNMKELSNETSKKM